MDSAPAMMSVLQFLTGSDIGHCAAKRYAELGAVLILQQVRQIRGGGVLPCRLWYFDHFEQVELARSGFFFFSLSSLLFFYFLFFLSLVALLPLWSKGSTGACKCLTHAPPYRSRTPAINPTPALFGCPDPAISGPLPFIFPQQAFPHRFSWPVFLFADPVLGIARPLFLAPVVLQKRTSTITGLSGGAGPRQDLPLVLRLAANRAGLACHDTVNLIAQLVW